MENALLDLGACVEDAKKRWGYPCASEAGAQAGLAPASRDRRDRERDREVERLRARAEKAEAELARHKAALDLMGKAHALLETLSESAQPPVTGKRSKK